MHIVSLAYIYMCMCVTLCIQNNPNPTQTRQGTFLSKKSSYSKGQHSENKVFYRREKLKEEIYKTHMNTNHKIYSYNIMKTPKNLKMLFKNVHSSVFSENFWVQSHRAATAKARLQSIKEDHTMGLLCHYRYSAIICCHDTFDCVLSLMQ